MFYREHAFFSHQKNLFNLSSLNTEIKNTTVYSLQIERQNFTKWLNKQIIQVNFNDNFPINEKESMMKIVIIYQYFHICCLCDYNSQV